jgi:tRNA-(ms[2]io[6]A)-hydroxylase
MVNKTKLGLYLPTDPRWTNLANMDLSEILSDHAYCEQKAASSCISLIQMYPDKDRLVEEVAPIVTEEWAHFRLVLHEIKKRGFKLGKQRKDEYVNGLLGFQKKGIGKDDMLTEKLLTCALIEARSCERFRLLSLDISDDNLKKFYYTFMVSEAGHYRLFLELAYHYNHEEKVKKRWKEYLEYEAQLISTLPPRGDRMH